MTRTMYDGIAGDAPAIARAFPGTDLIGGYIDGSFAWSQSDWDLFPKAKHVYITVSAADTTGDVIDCETGDATPDQAAQWVHARRAAGYDRPTVYCNLSTAGAVRAATGSLLLERDYDMWVADWTGSPHQIVFGDGRKAALTQYVSPQGGFYDGDEVYDDAWPHRTGSTPPSPTGNAPYRQVVPAGNLATLEDIAADRNWSLEKLFAYSMANMDPVNMGVMQAYMILFNACASSGHVQKPVAPTGMVYCTVHP